MYTKEVDVFLAQFYSEDQEVDDFLEHFGVKGMRWGIINKKDKVGSSAKRSSKSGIFSRLKERQKEINAGEAAMRKARAAKTQVRISEIQKEISALPPGFKSSYKRATLRDELQYRQTQKEADLRKSEKLEDAFLTSTQKKVLIGGAIVGGILATGVLASRGEDIAASIRRFQSKREHGSIFEVDKSLADRNLSPDGVLERVAKAVNPNYNRPGGVMNCRRSTFAYELRRRGFNVEATTSTIGRGQSESGLINALIRGDRNTRDTASLSSMIVRGQGIRGQVRGDLRKNPAFTETITGRDEVSIGRRLIQAFSKQPNGARGEVVFNETSFGHSMAWEIFGGQAHIFDAQKGTKYTVSESGLAKIFEKWGTPSETAITRLDNLDLDYDFLTRWARNAGR